MSALDNILDDTYIPFDLREWDDARAEWDAAKECIAEHVRQLEQARSLIDQSCSDVVAIVNMSDGYVHEMAEHLANQLGAWLAANAPAPDRTQHEFEVLAAHRNTICTCGMGGATMPEYHAKDCALYRMYAPSAPPAAGDAAERRSGQG